MQRGKVGERRGKGKQSPGRRTRAVVGRTKRSRRGAQWLPQPVGATRPHLSGTTPESPVPEPPCGFEEPAAHRTQAAATDTTGPVLPDGWALSPRPADSAAAQGPPALASPESSFFFFYFFSFWRLGGGGGRFFFLQMIGVFFSSLWLCIDCNEEPRLLLVGLVSVRPPRLS